MNETELKLQEIQKEVKAIKGQMWIFIGIVTFSATLYIATNMNK